MFCYFDAFTNLLDSKSNLDHAYGNATDRFPALLGCILRYKCTRGTRMGLRGAQFGNASHMKQTDDPRFKIGSFFYLKKRSFPEFIMHFLWGKCTQILIQLTEGRETSPFYTLSMDSQKQLRILQWSSIKVKKRTLITFISIFLNIYILFGQQIKLGTS